MKEVVVKITPQEQMRIKVIVMDKDKDEALEIRRHAGTA
jgi:hypothetical protein